MSENSPKTILCIINNLVSHSFFHISESQVGQGIQRMGKFNRIIDMVHSEGKS